MADELDNELLALADDDQESGEASGSGTPNSLGSGAMSQSDSESEAGAVDDDEGELYPIEGKFSSESDKAKIMAMSEIQREQVLAERAQEVESQTQTLRLKRLFHEREKKEAAEKKKRKAGVADLDDGQRKSSRQKVKSSEPLEAYKKQREERGRQRKRAIDRKNKERRSSSASDHSPTRGDSDVDAEGESEVEWAQDTKAQSSRNEPPPDLKDYNRVRVGRSNFAKVCFYPGFPDAITGCFCRVSIGPNMETGQNVYRMAQIKGFAEGKPYTMEGPNGKPFMTDFYAVLAHGKAQREFSFLVCSDSNFTEAEFERYKSTNAAESVKNPTRIFLSDRLAAIHGLLNHRWTDADIQEKLKKQSKYTIDATPKVMAPVKPSTAGGLDALNRANRKANIEEVRRALVAEKKAEQKARALAAVKKQADEAAKKAAEEAAAVKASLKVPGANMDDLFDGSDASRANTPVGGASTPKRSRAGTPLKERKSIATFKKRTLDDDVIASMDLGIEIDI